MTRRGLLISVVAATIGSGRPLRADPETPQLTHSEIELENRTRLHADQQRLQEEHAKVRRAQREKEQQADLDALHRDELDHDRELRTRHRHSGYKWAVTSGVFGGLAITAAVLGRNEDRSIRRGGLDSANAISRAVTMGHVYNDIGYSCLVVSGITALVAIPLVVFNLDRHELAVEPMAGGGAQGMMLSGRF